MLSDSAVETASGISWIHAMWVFVAVLMAVPLLFTYRARSLEDTDPSIDHAHFSVWVQDVRRASHVFPQPEPGESFRDALETDRSGLVHNVIRRVFNQPYRVFNLAGLVTYTASSFLTGDSFSGLLNVSIAFSVALIALLTLTPISLFILDDSKHRSMHLLAAVLTAGLAAGCFYLHYFAAQGWHNTAVSFMMAHLVTAVWLGFPASSPPARAWRPGRTLILLSFGVTLTLTIYAYFIMPWIVVPAFLAQLTASRRFREALKPTAGYLAFCAAITVPAGIILLVLWPQTVELFAQGQFSVSSVVARAVGWFDHGSRLLSSPAFAAGLVGLVILARRKFVFPLAFIAVHFVLSSVSAVGVWWHRSYMYALPFLILGLAYVLSVCTVRVFPWLRGGASTQPRARALTAVAGAVGIICTGSYVARQAGPLTSEDAMCSVIPSFCETYLGGDLRGLVRGVDALLPASAAFSVEDYPLFDVYRLLTRRSDVELLPPYRMLITRQEEGQLQEYISDRTARQRSMELFVLSGELDQHVLHDTLAAIFGPNGLKWSRGRGRLDKLATWANRPEEPGPRSLFRMRFD